MARHSTGQTNWSLSSNAIGMLTIIAALMVAVLTWWLLPLGTSNKQTDSQTDCLAGELTIAIASDAASYYAAEKLIQSWADTHPVVRDFCVKPIITRDLSTAAGYVGVSTRELDASARTSDGRQPQTIGALEVGVSGVNHAPSADAVAYPVVDMPEVSIAVASSLSEANHARALLQRDHALNSSEAAARGIWAAPLSTNGNNHSVGALGLIGVALTPSGGVTEEAQRAATEFLNYSAENYTPADTMRVDTALLPGEPAPAL